MRQKLISSATFAAALLHSEKHQEAARTLSQAATDMADFNAERARQRGQSKRSARAAANELVVVGQRTIVLNAIHPRWLRGAAAARLDAGCDVTEADLKRWKAQGFAATQQELLGNE